MGAEGKYDLMLALSHDPEKLRKDSTTSAKSEPGEVRSTKPKVTGVADPKSKVRVSETVTEGHRGLNCAVSSVRLVILENVSTTHYDNVGL